MEHATLPHDHDGDDEADNCLCGIELDENEITSDAELPAAIGGMEAADDRPDGHEDSEDIDGCDAVIADTDVTTDAELPVATGGVA